MPILYSANIDGVDDLKKKLKRIANTQQQAVILRSAVQAGMTPVLREAKRTAPQGTPGELNKSYRGTLIASPYLATNLKKTSWRGTRRAYAVARVGPRLQAFYGTSFVEIGTEHIKENPWLERANAAMKSQKMAAARKQLAKRIEALAKK